MSTRCFIGTEVSGKYQSKNKMQLDAHYGHKLRSEVSTAMELSAKLAVGDITGLEVKSDCSSNVQQNRNETDET